MDIKYKTMINGYEIGIVLGEGRYSTVYKAKREDGLVVAIKCASKSHDLYTETYIKTEKTIIKHLKPHVNVIIHFECFEDENSIYFVMEYIDGFSLRRVISESYLGKSSAKMDFESKKHVILSIISGVKFLHSLKIYHCDLKPENIIIDQDIVKIVDFGCSIYSETNYVHFDKKCINSTPGYGAPETIDFLSAGTTAILEGVDVWALGCVIYFIFTGVTPFAKKSQFETFSAVNNIDIDLKILPQPVYEICSAIFVKDIEKRMCINEVEELIYRISE